MNDSLTKTGKSFGSKKSATSIASLMTSELGKIPPQSTELEEAVLGALMIEKDALTTVIDILRPEVFYNPKLSLVYQAVVELFKQNDPVDLLTVSNQLKKMGQLDAIGGYASLAQLTLRINSSANIEAHARYLVELFIKRELIRTSKEVERDAFEETTDAFNVLDKAQQFLFELSEKNIRKSYEHISNVMAKAINEIKERKDMPDGLTGVPSGFNDLDNITSGWQKSDLVVVAGRPGMGKTAFVVSAARNAAVQFKRPVAIFSLEMSSEQLAGRLISSEAEIESEVLRSGKLSDQDWKQMMTRISTLEEATLIIDDTPSLSIMELRAKARRLVAQYGVEMLIIDYLQLMQAEVGGKSGNRQEEISLISRSLKNIAKELNVAVIALSQLSREVEKQGSDKRPALSHLRESGAIEQDADMVIFLYRPEYYNIMEREDGSSSAGLGEIIIAKNRHGSVGSVWLQFIGKYTKFANNTGSMIGGGMGFGGFGDGANSFSQMNRGSIPDEFNVGGVERVSLPSSVNRPSDGGASHSIDHDIPF